MEDLTDQQFYERLGEIKGTPTCSQWAEGFADSIREQIGKGRTLSDRQKIVCLKILKENSQEAQQSLANWEEEYETKFKSLGYKISSYYQAQGGGYYGNVATPVLAGKVPERRAFLKMINNKYAKKILTAYDTPHKFSSGDMVQIRANNRIDIANTNTKDGHVAKGTRSTWRLANKICMVMEVDSKPITRPAKGARIYKVLIIDETSPIYAHESDLKKVRRSKK